MKSIVCIVVLSLIGVIRAAEDQRELLSDHQTVAKLEGVKMRKCMGRTSLCPDRCGHSGNFASFQIVGYLSYKKPGKYGDEQAKTYLFQVDDNNGNPKIDKELAATVSALKEGDTVLLNWRHDYVTREGSKFPERIVYKLQRITAEEGDKLLKDAAK